MLLDSVIFLVLIMAFWLCNMVIFREVSVKGLREVFALVLQTVFVSQKLWQNKKLKKVFEFNGIKKIYCTGESSHKNPTQPAFFVHTWSL